MKNLTTRIPRVSALQTLLLAAIFLTASTNILATAAVDLTFGTNGRAAITTFGNSQNIAAITTQNNGKVVIVGYLERDGLILRYNQNGTLDASFGDGGKVILTAASRSYDLHGVAVQADGKIIAVGRVFPSASSGNTDFLVVRFNENGSLDNGFGTGGIITANQGSQDSFRAVKLQADGKIVAVGGTSDLGGRGAVFRFNQDGSYDESFGGGFVFIDFPMATNELFTSLDIYPNNRILLGGERIASGGGPGSRAGFAALLESNGMQVNGFGVNGFVGINLFSGFVKSQVKILPNGKFVAGGSGFALFTAEGIYQSASNGKNIAGFAVLSNGNLVSAGAAGSDPSEKGIRVYNKSLQIVGSDEKFDTGVFEAFDVAADLNDKIVFLTRDEIVRLNGITSNATRRADFDADNQTDVAVYRSTDRAFYALRTASNYPLIYQSGAIATQVIPEKFYRAGSFPYQFVYWRQTNSTNGAPAYFDATNGISSFTFQWGASGDIPVGGDYDGDGYTDFTVFRPSNGTWYISQSSNNQFRAFPFGQAGDRLVPADYDYDGITDFAVFRPSNGVWYISRSSDNGFRAVRFGTSGDIPITGDFDGDGRADFTAFRPSNGIWYSLKTREGFSAAQFGISSDQPVPGDYDGDGRHDIAVFRAGYWHLWQSRDGFRTIQWGLPGDVPVTVRY